MTIPAPLPPNLRCRYLQVTAFLPLLAAVLLLTPGQVRAVDEYEMKAVLIYKIAQLFKWTPSAFPDAKAPFTIGILGDDPFGSSLDSAVKGETVIVEKSEPRKFAVKRGRSIGALKSCQIVFVSKSENSRLGEILGAVAGQGILTIGESPGFCTQGGVLNFAFKGGTVGVEVSLSHVARERLKPSAQLLKTSTRLP